MPKTKKKRIESLWNDFSRKVIPPTAPPIQRKEMRRAFYAGVWGLLQEMKQLGDDDVSEDAGVEALEAIEAECKEFANRVGIDY